MNPANEQVQWNDVLDWEERQPNTPFWIHAAAGSMAGIAEHVAMFPVDTIKTRMQAISVSPGRSPQPGPSQQVGSHVAKALRTIIRGEGVAGLYRGVGAVAIGAG